jgi:hypothetical protein
VESNTNDSRNFVRKRRFATLAGSEGGARFPRRTMPLSKANFIRVKSYALKPAGGMGDAY